MLFCRFEKKLHSMCSAELCTVKVYSLKYYGTTTSHEFKVFGQLWLFLSWGLIIYNMCLLCLVSFFAVFFLDCLIHDLKIFASLRQNFCIIDSKVCIINIKFRFIDAEFFQNDQKRCFNNAKFCINEAK